MQHQQQPQTDTTYDDSQDGEIYAECMELVERGDLELVVTEDGEIAFVTTGPVDVTAMLELFD